MHSKFGWQEVATPHKGEWRCTVMGSGGPFATQVDLDLLRLQLCAGSWDILVPVVTTT